MKNKKKLVSLIPMLVFFAVMLLLHSRYQCANDDQSLILYTLKPSVWQEFSSIAHNFTSWSSRVLVNLPIHIILHFDYRVWLVIELLAWFVIVTGISYTFVDNERPEKNIAVCSLVLLFPLDSVTSAGWVTTTMTYIWPMAAGVIALTAIRFTQGEKKGRWYHYIMYAAFTIYGANQEQMSVFLFLVLGAYTVYTVFTKNVKPLIVMELVLTFANLMFHMLTPGNSVRNADSMSVYFPDYGRLSAIDKLEMGFSSTMSMAVFEEKKYLLILMLVLAAVVLQKHKNPLYRIMGVAPFLMELFAVGLKKLGIIAGVSNIGMINEMNYYRWQIYIPVGIMFAIGVMTVIALYLAFGDSFKSVLAIAMLVGGLAARMVVAFSSTVWASGNRTFTVFCFTLIFITVMLVNELYTGSFGKLRYAAYAVLVLMAAFNTVTIYQIL
jgi:hypothetical protein